MNATRTTLALVGCLVWAGCGASAETGSQAGPGQDAGTCEATTCGEECVELRSDRDHCGACDNACGDGESCSNGTCEACVETAAQATSTTLPADIIVVVDNSDSMTDEAADVQASMNQFVSAITATGIDAQVVLISADSGDSQGICVPAPLGSGSCPGDENLPGYRHVVRGVSSSSALNDILTTHPLWSASLRPNASKAIIVISDDDAGMTATTFSNMLTAADPTFTGFRFSAIVSPYSLSHLTCLPCALNGPCSSCDPCCGPDPFLGFACTAQPADEGEVYMDLVSQTAGVLGNLCTQDFLPAFQDVATAVIEESRAPCTYDIPTPPEGGDLDLGRVNVDFTASPGASAQTVPNVPDSAACGANGGWYYEPPGAPTSIEFCPVTCTGVQAAPEGGVTVKFGCSTVIL